MLGYRADAAPMSSRDASGKPAGYSVAAVRQSRRCVETQSRRCRRSRSSGSWWAPDSPRSQQHRADLVCSADAVTLANREQASFSIPIFPGGVSALVRSDASEQLQAHARGAPEAVSTAVARHAAADARPSDVLRAGRFRNDRGAQVAYREHASVGERCACRRTTKRVWRQSSAGSTDVLFGERAQLLQAVQRSPAAKQLTVLQRHLHVRGRWRCRLHATTTISGSRSIGR